MDFSFCVFLLFPFTLWRSPCCWMTRDYRGSIYKSFRLTEATDVNSFPRHVYLCGSKDKGSGLILDSEFCSAFVSYPFLYLSLSVRDFFPQVDEFTKWWEARRSQAGLFNRWKCPPSFMNCAGLLHILCSSWSGLVLLLVVVWWSDLYVWRCTS